jgi:hypothetical protein
VVNANGVVTVTNKDTGEVHTYTGITKVKFADMHVTFDVAGTAGQVYRLYQAAFNRKPDSAGLGYWINAAENGTSIDAVAAGFISSDEFTKMYGANVNAETFVTALYSNVLHRTPDQGGYDYWVKAVKSGAARNSVLTAFSESDENKNSVNPTIVNGIAYIPVLGPGDPIPVKSTSYANAKDQGLEAFTLPEDAKYADAYARADFKQNGNIMLFAAQITYDVKQPAQKATPSVFAFYSKNANGAWVKETSMIDSPAGCVHPRKAVVADFNNDGKPDVFVACTGYDSGTFPGENNFMVLSSASGVYVSKAVANYTGYFHSATAADFNNDGKIDVVVTDTNSTSKARMFLGNGDGTFTEDPNKLPVAINKSQLYTVEATDVDSDGKIDLLFGGDESMGATAAVVVVGDGTGNFTASRIVTLPGDAQNQSVMDFVVKNGAIYVDRTASAGPNFYNTKAIQKIDIATLASTIVFQANGQGWVKWLIPTATGVASANAQEPAAANF